MFVFLNAWIFFLIFNKFVLQSFAQIYKWHAKDTFWRDAIEKKEREKEWAGWQCQNEWRAKKSVLKARMCIGHARMKVAKRQRN